MYRGWVRKHEWIVDPTSEEGRLLSISWSQESTLVTRDRWQNDPKSTNTAQLPHPEPVEIGVAGFRG
jgi:hypothetical protein